MEFVCPVCNRLSSYVVECPKCGKGMEDSGTVQDFIDDYSPYLEKGSLINSTPNEICLHLFSCPQCNGDQQVPIQRIIL